MAYQSVGTPRFYINCIEWMHSLGQISDNGSFNINKYFTTSATNAEHTVLEDGTNDLMSMPRFGSVSYNKVMGSQSFIAILGHNLNSSDCELLFQEGHPHYSAIDYPGNEVNCGTATSGTNSMRPDYDGFSITTCDIAHWDQTSDHNHIRFESGEWGASDDYPYGNLGGVIIGAIILGTYYDLPHSPDLNLTMTREYGGIKTIETKGGASLSNDFGSKPPAWGSKAAWELGDEYSPSLSRSGRKIWDLSFSYLDQRDVWGANESLGNLSTDAAGVYTPHLSTIGADPNDYDTSDVVAYEGNYAFNYNLLTAPSFYSQVIHKTNGGQLPFIFQPDVNDNTQFAICKLDSGFKFTQVANGVYNVKLKIREVW